MGKAIDLVDFDQIYRDVFSYIFGDTLVFKNLNSARGQLGANRAVTIDVELLEIKTSPKKFALSQEKILAKRNLGKIIFSDSEKKPSPNRRADKKKRKFPAVIYSVFSIPRPTLMMFMKKRKLAS